MDISLESYELYNEIFLAESELFESMISFGADAIHESTGLISIQEGMKETVNKYITKITTAIQKAWERFKELVLNGKDDAWLKLKKDKILNGQPSFTINNFPEYDMNKFSNIKLVPFNYEEMKDSLESKQSFTDKYYGELGSGEGSISDKLEKIILKSRQDTKCTNEILKELYKFCADDFKSEVSKIEADLKTINDSNKNIERLLSTITADQSTQEAVSIYESYLLEDEQKEKTDKVSFTDDPSGPDSNNKSVLIKNIQIYMSASTDVLSAKMKLLKDIKKEYMNILKHYAGSDKESDNKKNNEEKEQPKDDHQINI